MACCTGDCMSSRSHWRVDNSVREISSVLFLASLRLRLRITDTSTFHLLQSFTRSSRKVRNARYTMPETLRLRRSPRKHEARPLALVRVSSCYGSHFAVGSRLSM